MSSYHDRCRGNVRRAGSFSALSHYCALGVALFACTLVGSLSFAIPAEQSRTAEGVYTDAQAKRGEAIFKERCSSCHGQTLGGGVAPSLAGNDFLGVWGNQPLSELVNKIRNTMPANKSGKLTPEQSADVVAYILQVGKLAAGQAELGVDEAVLKQITLPAAQAPSSQQPIGRAAGQAPSFPPAGNLAQVMRGILFPSSNLIFNAQSQDPGAPKATFVPGTGGFNWADWGAGIYSGWDLVDYAAVSLAESAPLMLTPGRRCENGKPVPVDRPDWIKYTQELADAGRAAYKASQSRNQDAVIEVTDKIAEACLNCHMAYRDRPGGTGTDPSNRKARCVP